MQNITYLLLLIIGFASCSDRSKSIEKEKSGIVLKLPAIEQSTFGLMPDGTSVDKYTLKNNNGMEVDVITYGGIITRWTAKNKLGQYEDIVLGYDSLGQYLAENPYFGALIGRYGNRIANGTFDINGTTYDLATNNGKNHLHGGQKGFDKVLWDIKPVQNEKSSSLVLTYVSPDGEEGYPGTLQVNVIYELLENDELLFSYKATTDKSTIVNLTQHSYFNLTADFSKDILEHELSIGSDAYLPVDEGLIPTGEYADVSETPFDFRVAKSIGKNINADDQQLKLGLGYDHCWILNEGDQAFRKVATAYEPSSGRYMEVYSDEPGLQFYSGNFLDGTLPAKGEGTYAHRSGFCLETQHYPDSPNQSKFPSVRLDPGQIYKSQTSYKFSLRQ